MQSRQLRKGAVGRWALISTSFPTRFASPNHHSMSGRKRVTSKVMENDPGLNLDWPW